MNKIPDKTNEVEQVRQQLNQSLMEYDKLLERFEKVEAELKTSKAENEKLERQKNLLRTSNDNLNKELDTMNELRKVFKYKIWKYRLSAWKLGQATNTRQNRTKWDSQKSDARVRNQEWKSMGHWFVFLLVATFSIFLVEKLRIEKDDIQAELDNEIDQVALWKQGLTYFSRFFQQIFRAFNFKGCTREAD